MVAAVGYLFLSIILWQKETGKYMQDALENQVTCDAEEGENQSQSNSENNDVSDCIDEISILEKLENFAEQNGFTVSEYPQSMIELLERNAETEDFVQNYPLKKGTYSLEPLEECLGLDNIPLLLQWDGRWGYYIYGKDVMGINGCGPTCMSMVALQLLQNPELTPIYMADYAKRNGYYVEGTGTAWLFMSEGAEGLGLHAKEVPLDETMVLRYLQQGNPIICIMGPGDFTESGHFIVFAGVKDGKIIVNDPNSKVRSEQLWNFEDIKYQIRNMWVYS